MTAVHLIEGVWEGVRGVRATDAAAACCAASMPEGDLAVVLGPAAAARRAAAMGVRVGGAWCSPLGMHGLWNRPVRRLVNALGAFDHAVAWTPGALRVAQSLGLPVTDQSTGGAWPETPPSSPAARDEVRRELREDLGGYATFLIGLVWDPPAVADSLTGVYGVGLLERAGLISAASAAMIIPHGTRGQDRAARLAAGVGQVTRLVASPRPLGEIVEGLDIAIVPPLEAVRGLAGKSHLEAARAWWIRRAVSAGVPVVAGPLDAEQPGVEPMTAWGRAELGRALRKVVKNLEAGAA